MPPLLVRPPSPVVPPEGLELCAPASKSEALRALVCAALAGAGRVGDFGEGALADDVRRLVVALGRLGVQVRREAGDLVVAGRPQETAGEDRVLDAGEGAAPARFLLALAATRSGRTTVTGHGQLRRRPMAPLLAALEALGARIHGGPELPVTVEGPIRGGEVTVDCARSSQFLSALLLVGPTLERGLRVAARHLARSAGYVALTREVMGRFGVKVNEDLVVPPGGYRERRVRVERDWSAATVLLAAAPFLGVPVRVPDLEAASAQPDRRFLLLAGAVGLEGRADAAGIRATPGRVLPSELGVGDCPDAVPALAALAARGEGWVRLRGAPQLRDKESDRIAALVALLEAAGVAARGLEDGLAIRGPLSAAEGVPPVRVVTRGDHRLAMAGALLGLARPVLIDDPGCVAKSFPDFFSNWPGAVVSPL